MIGIDGATVALPHGRPDSLATPLPEALAELESEFFVEWQVAGCDVLAPAEQKHVLVP